MGHYPQIVAKINSQVVHKSYPDLWTADVDKPVENPWKTGGWPVDNLGKLRIYPHAPLARPHSAHTPCA
jgi:hypothetical protein